MDRHPYQSLPVYTRWSRAVAGVSAEAVDPAVGFPFRISAADKIATAGSCFAQHIARHFKASGFNYYVVETGHPLASDELKAKFNYGTYPARFGNVYTSRQLLQLFRRAFETCVPLDIAWVAQDGSYIDPLRPNIQPGNYPTLEELIADRKQHLRCVRRMFENLDYLIFTLGLTECWYDALDGTVFPLCPGVAGGTFDPARHRFANLTVREVVSDMDEFIQALHAVNPTAQIILTVSPVPLAATAIDRHVLVSTTASKSVLRVACDELCANYPNVAYFPSYEVVMGPQAQGRYFTPDLRSVTEEGVAHVMRLFFRHATNMRPSATDISGAGMQETGSKPDMTTIVEAICEENLIEYAMRCDEKRASRETSLRPSDQKNLERSASNPSDL